MAGEFSGGVISNTVSIDAQTSDKISISVPSSVLKLDGLTSTLRRTAEFTLEFDLINQLTGRSN